MFDIIRDIWSCPYFNVILIIRRHYTIFKPRSRYFYSICYNIFFLSWCIMLKESNISIKSQTTCLYYFIVWFLVTYNFLTFLTTNFESPLTIMSIIAYLQEILKTKRNASYSAIYLCIQN